MIGKKSFRFIPAQFCNCCVDRNTEIQTFQLSYIGEQDILVHYWLFCTASTGIQNDEVRISWHIWNLSCNSGKWLQGKINTSVLLHCKKRGTRRNKLHCSYSLESRLTDAKACERHVVCHPYRSADGSHRHLLVSWKTLTVDFPHLKCIQWESPSFVVPENKSIIAKCSLSFCWILFCVVIRGFFIWLFCVKFAVFPVPVQLLSGPHSRNLHFRLIPDMLFAWHSQAKSSSFAQACINRYCFFYLPIGEIIWEYNSLNSKSNFISEFKNSCCRKVIWVWKLCLPL